MGKLRREEYTPRVSRPSSRLRWSNSPWSSNSPFRSPDSPSPGSGPPWSAPEYLCVCRRNGDLLVWGAARILPPFCFVLEVVAPGLLVIKHSRSLYRFDEAGKFVNVAVLQGDEVKVIDPQAAAGQDCPELFNPLLGLQSEPDSPDSVNVLIQLAVSMRAHGRGGLLLVVPEGFHNWGDSILHPSHTRSSPTALSST